MKQRDFELFIKNLIPDLYSFSYALIPDDLQASQVVLDSLGVIILEKKSLIENLLVAKFDENQDKLKKDFELYFYRILFQLTQKRLAQLRASLQESDSLDVPFFTLSLDEKAILFLDEWTKFNIEELCFIFGKEKIELLTLLNISKNTFKEKIERFSPRSFIPDQRPVR